MRRPLRRIWEDWTFQDLSGRRRLRRYVLAAGGLLAAALVLFAYSACQRAAVMATVRATPAPVEIPTRTPTPPPTPTPSSTPTPTRPRSTDQGVRRIRGTGPWWIRPPGEAPTGGSGSSPSASIRAWPAAWRP
ncbi:MAG: hypothetical protein RMM07_11940 [Anaerolineae bacterium]|nr:hypothetical protein [Anaerolineae bacterium]